MKIKKVFAASGTAENVQLNVKTGEDRCHSSSLNVERWTFAFASLSKTGGSFRPNRRRWLAATIAKPTSAISLFCHS
jgi:hypothetical protein